MSHILSCQNRNKNPWNCCSTRGRSATPGLPNMSCQNRNQNLWNCCSTGGRSATPGWPNMSCQNRNQNLWNCCSTGLDLPYLVSQIWSVRIRFKICEIAVPQGVDLPPLVGQIWAVRIGIKICEIAILLVGGRSATPCLPSMIPILTAHIWPTRGGRSTPCGTAISQILNRILTLHIWLTRYGRSNPVEQQFHRFWFLFWQLILGRQGVADLPPTNRMAISQILIPILTAHIWPTRCGRSTPCRTVNFSDFDSYSESSYLSNQVWQIYPHPIEWQFHRFWFLF